MGAVRVGSVACIAIGVAFVVGGSPAIADTSRSPNWAGYVVHRPHVSFSEVSAEWVQPSAACRPGGPTRSSIWVGLGGFRRGSRALEQVGTEVACAPSGAVHSSAWYELVPALSRGVARPVASGDLIAASVSVNGHLVRMTLTDLNRAWTYVKQVGIARSDTSSAEWIVESPSNCLIGPTCHPFALANFGAVIFEAGLVRARGGASGPIADPRWRATRVVLHRRRSSNNIAHSTTTLTAATPGPLLTYGTGFAVSYGAR